MALTEVINLQIWKTKTGILININNDKNYQKSHKSPFNDIIVNNQSIVLYDTNLSKTNFKIFTDKIDESKLTSVCLTLKNYNSMTIDLANILVSTFWKLMLNRKVYYNNTNDNKFKCIQKDKYEKLDTFWVYIDGENDFSNIMNNVYNCLPKYFIVIKIFYYHNNILLYCKTKNKFIKDFNDKFYCQEVNDNLINAYKSILKLEGEIYSLNEDIENLKSKNKNEDEYEITIESKEIKKEEDENIKIEEENENVEKEIKIEKDEKEIKKENIEEDYISLNVNENEKENEDEKVIKKKNKIKEISEDYIKIIEDKGIKIKTKIAKPKKVIPKPNEDYFRIE